MGMVYFFVKKNHHRNVDFELGTDKSKIPNQKWPKCEGLATE
jgi:hypothetical protein